MNASDLRIGNLIGKSSEVIVVKSIDEYGINVSYDRDYGEEYEGLFSDLTPIPITKEWLLKASFFNDENNSDLYYISQYFSTMAPRPRFALIKLHKEPFEDNHYQFLFYDVEKEQGIISLGIKIKYLHELQNMYWALKGEDLTINK